ncbi:unnamed protein product [Bemisia tabaci]|uniref:Uncharacterized protein n=1 Tax=Bemisia tabaci TaxID=7038 RepID=A0A9P0ANT4_BEMTA|nr:unnamed protein product [Bemisia tabaci]
MWVLKETVAFVAATLFVLQYGTASQGAAVDAAEPMIKSIENTGTSIGTVLDKNLERTEPKEKEILEKIQTTSSMHQPSNLWLIHELYLSSEIERAKNKIRAGLCDQYRGFRKFIIQIPPADAKLRDWMGSDEYDMKTVSPHLETEVISPLLVDRRKRKDRLLPIPEFTSGVVADRKRYFSRRVRELTNAYDYQMELIEEGANAVLNAMYNAVLTWAGMDEELFGDMLKPESIEDKADVVQLGLNVGDDLKCPRNVLKGPEKVLEGPKKVQEGPKSTEEN